MAFVHIANAEMIFRMKKHSGLDGIDYRPMKKM